ncbi:hypothetical protein NDR87_33655 [Nocardia sp. CDC159]|uniref:Uncharacterized protein n=1 Tax=Nocardia pulmonis TaxID=2951408 RepID=A0A9X2EGR3_9NOCA|nr:MULTISPECIES: hypothetical protein [Nocardia]MCM6778443.1 hypothetical protein [Nocardia pulmonis]MCM6791332.1 hypothetical protein [Nocardia sp. CDC159]
MLLPEAVRGEQKGNSRAADLLRSELEANPQYDWEKRLRDQACADGKRYWSEAMDDALAEGWVRGRSWRELVTATGATELEIARRCKRRGWVKDLAGVVDRIGCDPHGEVAAQLDPAKVWVLVIDGLGSGERHVSVHPTRGQAEDVRDRLVDEHVADDSADPIAITLVARSPAGEAATRPAASGNPPPRGMPRADITLTPPTPKQRDDNLVGNIRTNPIDQRDGTDESRPLRIGIQLGPAPAADAFDTSRIARAFCDCGWAGSWQATIRQAETDVADHGRVSGHEPGAPFSTA